MAMNGAHPQVVINKDVRQISGVSDDEFEKARSRELAEIERRREVYLQGCDRVPIKDTTAIVIDDGIATGATVHAALKALRRSKPKKLVLALAVAPRDTVE